MDPNSIEKLLHAANFLIRVSDTEAIPILNRALNIVLSVITDHTGLRFEADYRQYRLSQQNHVKVDESVMAEEKAAFERRIIPILDELSTKTKVRALVHLATLRLEGKITDADV